MTRIRCWWLEDAWRAVLISLAALIVTVSLGTGRAAAAPGDLDLSFGGGDGIASETAGVSSRDGLAIDALGRIYVQGNQRFLPDGLPDPAFGPHGFRPGLGGDDEYGTDFGWDLVKVAGPGRLVVSGLLDVGDPESEDPEYNRDALWFGSDSPDDQGHLIQLGRGEGPDAVAVAADGRIAAMTNLERIWMVDSSGKVDKGFGRKGSRRLPRGYPEQIAFDPQGRLVILLDQRVVRLRRDGSLDRSFGAGGEIAGHSNQGAMAVDERGGIVFAGRSRAGVEVSRVTPKGRLDRSFAGDGRTRMRPARRVVKHGATISGVVLAGPRILIGYSAGGGDHGLRVSALTAKGKLDSTFGERGHVYTPLTPSKSRTFLEAMALSPTNQLIVAADVSHAGAPIVAYKLD